MRSSITDPNGLALNSSELTAAVPEGPGYVLFTGIEFISYSNSATPTRDGVCHSEDITSSHLAPVKLPQGAVITQIVVHYFNWGTITTPAEVSLITSKMGSIYGDLTFLVQVATQAGGGYTTGVPTSNATITNIPKAYLIQLNLREGPGS